MANENTDATTQVDEAPEAQEAESSTQDEQNDDNAQEALDLEAARKLRSENKSLRDRLRDIESKMTDAEKAQQKAEEDQLAEQEKWQDLAEKRAARLLELEPLEPRVTEIEKERDSYKSALQAHVDAQLASVPEHITELLSDRDPIEQMEWLDKHAETFRKQGAAGVPDSPSANGDTKMSETEKRQLAALPGRDY